MDKVHRLIYLLFLFCFINTFSIGQELKSVPKISLKPLKLNVYYNDTVKFIRERIKVLNTGAAPLTIKEVRSSCGCATAAVGRALIHPTSVGQIYLNIDASRLTDSAMRVDYYIHSNAQDSVFTYPVYLYKRKTSHD